MESHFLLPGIWRPLVSLILASTVVMGSPGPSTISATAVGASFGFRRSLSYVFGLVLGAVAVLAAVAAGLVAVLFSVPGSARTLTGISAAYLLFLAFRIAAAPPLESRAGDPAPPAFSGGFLLAIANPKAYLAIAAVFAGVTPIADDRLLDAIVKVALLSIMIVLIHFFWLLAGSLLSHLLRDPVSARVINLALVAVLVITTVSSLMD